jgi:glutathione peroxidase-family protein
MSWIMDKHNLRCRAVFSVLAVDVEWNFEKFLISPDGSIVARFRPQTPPTSDEVVAAIEAILLRAE